MYRIGEILSILDQSLNTKRKRHMAGGILLSISLLFGGLALTITTLKTEEEENENELYLE